ncbi:MAG TPA: ACT domain-containing protein [Halanaerobiaceae bacterium]|jgi:ACT domain-containing protein|nr:ACT domain-containing protein [Bacillota bacterium]HHU93196.1 ACT domain-containing protein [Halanaerobiaceae bacterium]HOA40024.1 ACT domain-containing protein [Halanaerobiales bacterium]HPZ62100.1 ACT domain-containing protein [Halanaerobiales bacterium]HQD03403.1 ACT domain-containing protein [Halanaerobiales bacterium]
MRGIITVIGMDKIGIIARVSTLLAQSKINILDISQTILGEYFTMMMLVDLENMELSLEEMKEKLNELGEELEVSIKLQHEDIFRSMHRI